MTTIKLGNYDISNDAPFTLLAGPCVLESRDHAMFMCENIKKITDKLGINLIYKSSFDKANRTRFSSKRGPGLAKGLSALSRVKEQTGLPILTDIHEPSQVAAAAEVVDVLQIPAFLSRQTDLLIAAGGTGKPVNLKKGQWMCKEEVAGAVEKLRSSGTAQIAVTERGTFFGYNNLVVDMRVFAEIGRSLPVPVFFDGTHSVQRPGISHGSTGGNPEYVPMLVRAAVAAGCAGLYLETHPHPETSPSDSSTMVPLTEMEDILDSVMSIRTALYPSEQE